MFLINFLGYLRREIILKQMGEIPKDKISHVEAIGMQSKMQPKNLVPIFFPMHL